MENATSMSYTGRLCYLSIWLKVPMQTQKVIPISPLCTVVVPSHNASQQIQVLRPGKSTYSSIPRKKRPAYCHQPYPSPLLIAEWTGVVCSLQSTAFLCRKDTPGDIYIHEETHRRHSDHSVLFSLVRKWLKVRGCYHRTMILRIVCGGRNMFRI